LEEAGIKTLKSEVRREGGREEGRKEGREGGREGRASFLLIEKYPRPYSHPSLPQPQGGFFLLGDVSHVAVPEVYLREGKTLAPSFPPLLLSLYFL